nr:hypothetical protein [uncultured Sphingomonas sp.]
MTDLLSEAFLKAAICELTEVVRTSQGYEVTLPQAYASGNVVAVVIAPVGKGFVVHDNSYAAMLLERTGTSKSLTLVSDVEAAVAHYGCKLEHMRVTRSCETIDEVALSAVLVGSASRLVADQALKADRLPVFDFKSRLLGRVTEIVGERRVRTNEQVTGHLGSKYKVSTVVLDPLERQPLAFVEPISDASAVARRFKEFYDISLNPAYQRVERVSVIDDERSIPAGDVLLMQEVGALVRYSDSSKLFQRWATLQ